MTKHSSIIKGDDISIEGSFQLDLESQPGQQTVHTQPAASAEQPKQVRIVENNDQFAIIEITCSCGNKMHVKCQYNGGASNNAGANQIQQPES